MPGGEKDRTVPHAVFNASFKIESRNEGITEFAEIEARGHSLAIVHAWREVCERALAFVKRFVSAGRSSFAHERGPRV